MTAAREDGEDTSAAVREDASAIVDYNDIAQTARRAIARASAMLSMQTEERPS